MATRLLLAAVLFLAMPAVAQVAPTRPPASPVVEATPGKAVEPIDRHCVRHAGSRIRSDATARRRDCGSGRIGRVYSRDDIDRTGHTDIWQALRALDPAIY